MTWLAPAIRLDDFGRLVLPALRDHRVGRFASFGLENKAELNDTLEAGALKIYHKSLPYLVSRGLETVAQQGPAEIPILGIQRCAEAVSEAQSMAAAVGALGRGFVWAPNFGPAASQTNAASHGGFDDDVASMTSIMPRTLGLFQPSPVNVYRAHTAFDGARGGVGAMP